MDNELILEGQENKEEEVQADEPTPAPETSSEEEIQPQEAPVEEPPLVEENGVTETSIKTFTQPEVDKIVGETRVKTREKTFNYIYNRYGVKSEQELDDLVANAQRYDTQKEMYDSDKNAWETERKENDARLTDMSEQIALMQSGVDKERYEDVKLILKGKGLPVTVENIQAELETHPEWMPSEEVATPVTSSSQVAPEEEANPTPAPAPTTTTRIKALGNEPKPAPQMSEEEEAERLFKLKFHK